MGKVITGPRVIFRINQNKVARASNVSFNETITVEDVNVLDQIEPDELAETGYTVDFNCQKYITEDETIKELGIMPKFTEILKAGVMTAELVDHLTDKVLFVLSGVKSLGRSGTIDARGTFTETWNFRGLKEES